MIHRHRSWFALTVFCGTLYIQSFNSMNFVVLCLLFAHSSVQFDGAVFFFLFAEFPAQNGQPFKGFHCHLSVAGLERGLEISRGVPGLLRGGERPRGAGWDPIREWGVGMGVQWIHLQLRRD